MLDKPLPCTQPAGTCPAAAGFSICSQVDRSRTAAQGIVVQRGAYLDLYNAAKGQPCGAAQAPALQRGTST